MCLRGAPDIKEAPIHTKTYYTKHSILCWKSTGHRVSLRVVAVLVAECVVCSSELVSMQIAGVRDWESYICHRSWQISVWRVIHITTQPWTDSYCAPLGLGFCINTSGFEPWIFHANLVIILATDIVALCIAWSTATMLCWMNEPFPQCSGQFVPKTTRIVPKTTQTKNNSYPKTNHT